MTDSFSIHLHAPYGRRVSRRGRRRPSRDDATPIDAAQDPDAVASDDRWRRRATPLEVALAFSVFAAVLLTAIGTVLLR